jgi:hypothetical protein
VRREERATLHHVRSLPWRPSLMATVCLSSCLAVALPSTRLPLLPSFTFISPVPGPFLPLRPHHKTSSFRKVAMRRQKELDDAKHTIAALQATVRAQCTQLEEANRQLHQLTSAAATTTATATTETTSSGPRTPGATRVRLAGPTTASASHSSTVSSRARSRSPQVPSRRRAAGKSGKSKSVGGRSMGPPKAKELTATQLARRRQRLSSGGTGNLGISSGTGSSSNTPSTASSAKEAWSSSKPGRTQSGTVSPSRTVSRTLSAGDWDTDKENSAVYDDDDDDEGRHRLSFALGGNRPRLTRGASFCEMADSPVSGQTSTPTTPSSPPSSPPSPRGFLPGTAEKKYTHLSRAGRAGAGGSPGGSAGGSALR